MINNIDLIKPLFNFADEHDFYMLYILKRKKDQPAEERDNHQSVRTVKSYQIYSLEQLDKRMPEIMQLCEMFRARAYIHINKHNHKTLSLLMMERLAGRIRTGVVNQAGLFDSIVGEMHSPEKRWIIDIDTKNEAYRDRIKTFIDHCQPEGYKLFESIPTKNGFHFITKAFNVKQFKDMCEEQTKILGGFVTPDIQRRNPTLLYLPNSLQ